MIGRKNLETVFVAKGRKISKLLNAKFSFNKGSYSDMVGDDQVSLSPAVLGTLRIGGNGFCRSGVWSHPFLCEVTIPSGLKWSESKQGLCDQYPGAFPSGWLHLWLFSRLLESAQTSRG